MSFAADRILEYLDKEGAASPSQIANDDRIRFGRDHTNQVLLDLRKAALVEMIGNGVYRITEKGRGYLLGQEDLRNEPEPE